MESVKSLVLTSIFACSLAMLLGYWIGRRDAMSELRNEYPYLENIAKTDIYEPGTIWLTHNPTRDTFAVNVCRGGRYEKVYAWPEN